jgi:hypothetical protein
MTYAITKKNKHISRIKISDNYKIVTRCILASKDSMQKLGTKTQIFVATKIIWTDSA